MLTSAVDENVQRRMKRISEVQELLKEHGNPSEFFTLTVTDVRKKDEERREADSYSDSDDEENPMRERSDAELEKVMRRARSWLLDLLDEQERLGDREELMSLIRTIVEKGKQPERSEFS